MGRLNSGIMSSARTGTGRDDWGTPPDLFAVLDREFSFCVDVCASAENALCSRFFSIADDGLAQAWPIWTAGACWMNPPYSKALAWLEKAVSAALSGSCVVCLVPARTETAWMWDHARRGQVRLLRGRLNFVGGRTQAPFPSAVVIMRPFLPWHLAEVVFWDWREAAGLPASGRRSRSKLRD